MPARFLVFLLAGVSALCAVRSSADPAEARARDIEAARAAIQAQVQERGGWPSWSVALELFHENLRQWDAQLNTSGDKAIRMSSGLVFNGFDFSYHLSGSFLHPAGDAATYSPVYANITDLATQLSERGIDLIFVPIPPKSEVCPESLSPNVLPGCGVSPERVELMGALLDAGVEVIDLLPGFLEAKAKSENDCMFLAVDTHWNYLGIASAARQIAERLRRYDFVPAAGAGIPYAIRRTAVRRVSSMVKYMDSEEKNRYPSEDWTVEQILKPDGSVYQDVDDSPVLVLGDSFTTFFAEDSGGISAHLAKELGMPVSVLGGGGNGPNAPRLLARQGHENIARRRVILWMVVGRYLIPARWPDWQTAKLP